VGRLLLRQDRTPAGGESRRGPGRDDRAPTRSSRGRNLAGDQCAGTASGGYRAGGPFRSRPLAASDLDRKAPFERRSATVGLSRRRSNSEGSRYASVLGQQLTHLGHWLVLRPTVRSE